MTFWELYSELPTGVPIRRKDWNPHYTWNIGKDKLSIWSLLDCGERGEVVERKSIFPFRDIFEKDWVFNDLWMKYGKKN